MKNHKMYEAEDKMISLISDNYDLLQALGSFGINLGFGDKTVREVCDSQNVDTYTFLSIVNFTMNGYKDYDDADRLSIPTLVKYLKAFHTYYLDFQLPFIRKKLEEAENYIESEKYFSWERYFTDLLMEETKDSPYPYDKSNLKDFYLQDKIVQKVLDAMAPICLAKDRCIRIIRFL